MFIFVSRFSIVISTQTNAGNFSLQNPTLAIDWGPLSLSPPSPLPSKPLLAWCLLSFNHCSLGRSLSRVCNFRWSFFFWEFFMVLTNFLATNNANYSNFRKIWGNLLLDSSRGSFARLKGMFYFFSFYLDNIWFTGLRYLAMTWVFVELLCESLNFYGVLTFKGFSWD